jgi:hypothetical protein
MQTLLFQIALGLSIREYLFSKTIQGAPPFQTLPHHTTSRQRLYSLCLESIALHTYVRTVSYHLSMSTSLTVQFRICYRKSNREDIMEWSGDQSDLLDYSRLHTRWL